MLNVGIATLAAVMIVVGAACDNTFTLINGVGLLEHPGIWLYLLAQPVLPQLLDRAVRTFTRIGIDQRQLFTSAFARTTVRAERKLLFERIKRTSAAGTRVFYQILVLVGAGAWILNTFKNQAPLLAYGFDVWDAWPHLWGYWTTRVYKAYVAMFLAPAMVHALIVIVYSITQLMVCASREAGMKLDPYAADEAGGTRRLIDMVLNPLVPIVLTASLMSVAAVYVHQRFDSTTIGGLALTIAIFVGVYVIPATALRFAIVADKRRQRSELRERQAKLYAELKSGDIPSSNTHEQVTTIQDLGVLIERVDTLPTWPQLTRVAATISAAATSPVIGLLLGKSSEVSAFLRAIF